MTHLLLITLIGGLVTPPVSVHAQEMVPGLPSSSSVHEESIAPATAPSNASEPVLIDHKVHPEVQAEFDALLHKYFKAAMARRDFEKSDNKYTLESTEADVESARIEINTFFQQRFFRTAFKDQVEPFAKGDYLAALKKIENYSKQFPDEVSLLAASIQSLWHRAFYDVFRAQHDEHLKAKLHGGHMAVAIASLAVTGILMAGHLMVNTAKGAGRFFAIFKSYFGKGAPAVSAPVAPVAGEAAAAAAAPLVEKLPLWKKGFQLIGENPNAAPVVYTVVGSLTGVVLAKFLTMREVPLPPAMVVTLAHEPAELRLEDIDQQQFYNELISGVGAGVASAIIANLLKIRHIVSAARWVTAYIAGSQGAAVGAVAGTAVEPVGGTAAGGVGGMIAGTAISVALWTVIDDQIRKGLNGLEVRSLKKELKQAINEATVAQAEGNSHRVLRTAVLLNRSAQRLAALYRYQYLRDEVAFVPGERSIKFMVMNKLETTAMLPDGTLDSNMSGMLAGLWQSNADDARYELNRRSSMSYWQKAKNMAKRMVSDVAYCSDLETIADVQLRAQTRVLCIVSDQDLEMAVKIGDAAQEVIGSFSGHGSSNFRAFLSDYLAYEAALSTEEFLAGRFAHQPDDLLIQASGFIRQMSSQRSSISGLILMSDEITSAAQMGAPDHLFFSRIVPSSSPSQPN